MKRIIFIATLGALGAISLAAGGDSAVAQALSAVGGERDAAARSASIARLEATLANADDAQPDVARGYLKLAQLYYLNGRYDRAVFYFEACIGSTDADDRLRFLATHDKAHALRHLGQIQEALAAYRSLKSMPAPPETKAMVANESREWEPVLLEQIPGKEDQASAQFFRMAKPIFESKTEPSDRDLQTARQYLNHVKGQREKTKTLYDSYLAHFPKSKNAALIAFDRATLMAGAQEKVTIEQLDSIVSTYDTNSESGQRVKYQLAVAYLWAKDEEAGGNLFEQIVAWPSHKENPFYNGQLRPAAMRMLVQGYDIRHMDEERDAMARLLAAQYPLDEHGQYAASELKKWHTEPTQTMSDRRRNPFQALEGLAGVTAVVGSIVFVRSRKRGRSR